jgi:site-specific DNA-methyltransferase (adenine-specific)
MSKDIDRILGKKRKKIGEYRLPGYGKSNVANKTQKRNVFKFDILDGKPISKQAKKWKGWSTALKPAQEPILIARKPLLESNIAKNLLKHGAGAMNIDATRIAVNSEHDDPRLGGKGSWKTDKAAKNVYAGGYAGKEVTSSNKGRWPANIIHDGSQLVVVEFPHGHARGNIGLSKGGNGMYGHGSVMNAFGAGDSGSAARFFYCAKASKSERGDGNNHPTVKPIALMRYLVKMFTPEGGRVLDPFLGSGTTGIAVMLEGKRFVGVEKSKDYFKIARKRVRNWRDYRPDDEIKIKAKGLFK